jgi:hypothetical protein
MTPCILVENVNVSEDFAAFIFTVEDILLV